ncbi:TraR/DksA family transcriptional regulator [uncultured Jatrophihabitans sp.]|uniref:TraR/DksA family transcriptional regulator n=1 Tax=uncultured Jatrophihabitans sp. TaxID=1610747 RepID=UPI0035CBC18F
MTSLTMSSPSPTTVEQLRRRLVAQRDFRLEQLQQLEIPRDARTMSRAHREVYISLAVGARTALHELNSALRRIETGRFGRCVTCDTALEPAVLETLPQTARCLDCQRAALDDEPSAATTSGAAAAR